MTALVSPVDHIRWISRNKERKTAGPGRYGDVPVEIFIQNGSSSDIEEEQDHTNSVEIMISNIENNLQNWSDEGDGNLGDVGDGNLGKIKGVGDEGDGNLGDVGDGNLGNIKV
ncbi:hypothetical protein Tco_0615179 [Tanacetum coccineum]